MRAFRPAGARSRRSELSQRRKGASTSSKNSTRVRKPLLWALLVGLPLFALAVAGATHFEAHGEPSALLTAPRHPLLPDLTMPPLSEFFGAAGAESHVPKIFFTASIANVGAGPFIVAAT